MLKQLITASLCLLFASAAARAEASLTAQETRWLAAAGPVLAFSQRLNLPIDITVQPRSGPGDVPLAMGFDGKRCKLVLSLRGNPDAEAILEKFPEAQRGVLIEAMAAHEVGHCWRYARGVWHALPAGFVDTGAQDDRDDHAFAQAKAMRDSRREEGFADLVALAWISRNHPDSYASVYSWLESLRGAQPPGMTAHDTLVWVQLAADASAFAGSANPFNDVQALWSKGVLMAER
jgi:hypothetical protein